MINGFDSCLEYARFAMAKGFLDTRTNSPYAYSKHFLERVGDRIVRPVLGGLNVAVQNIYHPPVISALAMVAITAVTAFLYPERIPDLPFLSGGNIRFLLFSGSVATIVGLCLRTLGRLQGKLFEEWQLKNGDKRYLRPIRIGE